VSSVLKAVKRIDVEGPIDRPGELELPHGLDQYAVSFEKGAKP